MRQAELVLTDEERAALELLARSARRAEADRARAILRSAAGESSVAIAPAVGVRPDHVRFWRMRFRKEGVEALRERPPRGRTPVKATAALPQVQAILSDPPPEGVVWTVPRLREEVARRAGVTISVSWLRMVMHEKGGFAGAVRGTRSRGGRRWLPSRAAGCG
jgi:transposase